VLLLRTGAHRHPCEVPILTSQESVHNQRDRKRLGAPILESYGMTEASHQMASNPLPPKPRKAGKVGYGFGAQKVGAQAVDASGHRNQAPTEVNAVVGAVVELGRIVGVPTPVTDTLYRAVELLEKRVRS
jgi:acyl-CoA synthetase (AMP-forming)/AMP-acid ligase II